MTARTLFFRLFGLTAFVAVGSYAWQFEGLAGVHGIVPIGQTMEALRQSPQLSFVEVPTLLWLSDRPWVPVLMCGVAMLSAVALMAFVAPRLACLTLWASWLSLVTVGQPFLSFQWDVLLVETALCGAVYAPGGLRPKGGQLPSRGAELVMLLLAFKVTFESGLVKVLSHDPSWRDLTALTYHWWTQPLPAWTSVWLSTWPLWLQRVLCGVMFVLELGAPVLLFGPPRSRQTAAVLLIALQVGLFVGGNYSFYNVLTAVLAVPALRSGQGRSWREQRGLLVVAGLYGAISVAMFTGVRSGPITALRRFDSLNAYGAFAHMTKSRREILLEGSSDGVTWFSYELPWKPGALDRRPRFVAPWQPRLDWQLWFAALGSCADNEWVLALQQRLLEGRAPVLALFDNPPASTPKYLRTRTFEYRFAPLAEPGVWWRRSDEGVYCPPVMLSPEGRLQRAE